MTNREKGKGDYEEIIKKDKDKLIHRYPLDGEDREDVIENDIRSLHLTLTNIAINYSFSVENPEFFPESFGIADGNKYKEEEDRTIKAIGQLERRCYERIYFYNEEEVDAEKKHSNVYRYAKPIDVILRYADKPSPQNGFTSLDDVSDYVGGLQIVCDIPNQVYEKICHHMKDDELAGIDLDLLVEAFWKPVWDHRCCYLQNEVNIGVYLERINIKSKLYHEEMALT